MKPFLFAIFASGAAVFAHAAESPAEIIAKARKALGEESALTAMKSLRMTCDSVPDKDGRGGGLQIYEYKFPVFQRELDYTKVDTSTHKPLEVITGTNGDVGFRVFHMIGDARHILQIMDWREVELRADLTVANLNEFSAPPPLRGAVTLGPDEKIDGVDCFVLNYEYKSGATIVRYVDKATSRYVASRIGVDAAAADPDAKAGKKTSPADAALIVYKGSQKVAGITFPETIVVLDKAGKAERTLKLSKVEVNPEMSDSDFSPPSH